jgi:hypothetical protein
MLPGPDSIFLKWGRFQLVVSGRLALAAVVVVSLVGLAALWVKVAH